MNQGQLEGERQYEIMKKAIRVDGEMIATQLGGYTIQISHFLVNIRTDNPFSTSESNGTEDQIPLKEEVDVNL